MNSLAIQEKSLRSGRLSRVSVLVGKGRQRREETHMTNDTSRLLRGAIQREVSYLW